MSSKRLSPEAMSLEQLFTIYHLNQLIKSPTRITDRTSSIKDLVLTYDRDKIVSSGVLTSSISDHSLIFVIRSRADCKNVHYRNFKYYKHDDFSVDLQSESWDMINTSLTIEDACLAYKNTLHTLMDKHAPICSKRVRHTTLPLITADIRISMKNRVYHHKRAQKTGFQLEWLAYRSM